MILKKLALISVLASASLFCTESQDEAWIAVYKKDWNSFEKNLKAMPSDNLHNSIVCVFYEAYSRYKVGESNEALLAFPIIDDLIRRVISKSPMLAE